MTNEQEKTIEIFRKSFRNEKKKKIIIYGTGINAQAIVEHCRDYCIIGLLDQTETGNVFWGLKVLSEKEAIESGCTCIVIVARPAVHSIIYKRVSSWVKEHNIPVYDIWGNLVDEKGKKNSRDLPCLNNSYEQLRKDIERYDAISFDIFDTLLLRYTLRPEDVWELIGKRVHNLCENFSVIRRKAQTSVQEDADIYQIYKWIRDNAQLSERTCYLLMQEEIMQERRVIRRRELMVQCFYECLQAGKKIYLVSDMYLPEDILNDILKDNGITGYEVILVSCDYNTSKKEDLFEILKKRLCGLSCLHIGDNYERDYQRAKENGLDAVEIASTVKMMEFSAYGDVLAYTKTIGQRVMLGMIAADLFQNPFALCNMDGRPNVVSLEQFGRIFIEPLLTACLLWMMNEIRNQTDAVILFSARDGYLWQKGYRILKEAYGKEHFPRDRYLLISRRAIEPVLEGELHSPEIDRYRKYVDKLIGPDATKVYFFDFMSRGTCQYGLQKLLQRPLIGLYVQKSSTGDERDSLHVKAFYKQLSAMQSNCRIFAMCDFLECIFSSPKPSFLGLDKNGKPRFEKEVRTEQQLKMLAEIWRGVLSACKEFVKCMPDNFDMSIDPEFCDEILNLTRSEFSLIDLPELLQMELDDAGGEKRNTGKDVLL